jgi:hypothetical protein
VPGAKGSLVIVNDAAKHRPARPAAVTGGKK